MNGSVVVPASVIASLTEEVLQKGGRFSFSVRGTSMRPTLRDGDRVEVGPVSKEVLAPGQILVYRAQGDADGMVVHRLMRLETQKGETVCRIGPDAAPLCPETVSLNRLLGIVERLFRGSRELSLRRGWRFWWGRFLVVGYHYPWMLRILFRLGRIRRRFFSR